LSWLHALWNDLWPNTVAPSIWTLLAVAVSHVRAARQRQRHHEDMKQHVTSTMGAPGD
jgi:DMSO/TMAO reductase YedYZ heme-binding membrane subunit